MHSIAPSPSLLAPPIPFTHVPLLFVSSLTTVDALPPPFPLHPPTHSPRACPQAGFKTRLLADVRTFVGEVVAFRRDYLTNGPMAPGISPQDAIDRLRRYHEVGL